MDAFVRTYLPFEQYDEARITAHLTDNDVPRDDDYWQAYIVDPGKSKKFLITLEIIITMQRHASFSRRKN